MIIGIIFVLLIWIVLFLAFVKFIFDEKHKEKEIKKKSLNRQ